MHTIVPVCVCVCQLATRLNYLHIRFAFALFAFPRMPCTSSISHFAFFPLFRCCCCGCCCIVSSFAAQHFLCHCGVCIVAATTAAGSSLVFRSPAFVPLPHNECNFLAPRFIFVLSGSLVSLSSFLFPSIYISCGLGLQGTHTYIYAHIFISYKLKSNYANFYTSSLEQGELGQAH